MNSRTIVGGVLVLLGGFLFLNQGGTFGPGTMIGLFWPTLFILPVSLLFHWMYFAVTGRRGVGLLIPGGVLLTVGIVCQISMLFNIWSYMWPGFILAPAVGLFEFYWFGNRNKWLLIPINVLTVLSLMFFAFFSIGTFFSLYANQPIVALVLVVFGAFLLIGTKKSSERS